MPNTTAIGRTDSPEFWLTVQEAAGKLGIKRRRMLDYRDTIKSRKVDNPRSGKAVLMFEQAAVEDFLRQRGNGAVMAMPPSKGGTTALVQALTAAVQQPAPAPPPPAAPLGVFLNLEQASVFAGLSARALRSMIRSGELRARRDGRQWKVRQAALLEIADEDFGVE